ncbi:hypothetical protein JDV02_002230 [Purpureocillium takamizusanense]|uniref:Uncharacterized protein n=1 Tax=Purpureocillium takamizusanense TaxID=2060973 RepID=A0A9Q8V8C2_9HYPO|nr:uncharacterized protein JDV02_002230 [Purpureocillium takamizusanense]UNI15724.1 hypothetical protein JDV02_002230 [Purpureocillium takamizusanense]
MPSPQVAAPIAMSSQRNNLRLMTSQDLYASLNATLGTVRPSTPVRHIKQDDYTVPAPPPPSPVSFRSSEHWHAPSRR